MVRHLSRPRRPFWGPLADILDFAGVKRVPPSLLGWYSLCLHTHEYFDIVEENQVPQGYQDISSNGQKFESPKKSNFCTVELLSSNSFQFIWKFVLNEEE